MQNIYKVILAVTALFFMLGNADKAFAGGNEDIVYKKAPAKNTAYKKADCKSVAEDRACKTVYKDVVYQEVVYVNSPNVVVDLSVLDDMGDTATPVRLSPPSGVKSVSCAPASKIKNEKVKLNNPQKAKKKAKPAPAKPVKPKAEPQVKPVPVAPLNEEEKQLPAPKADITTPVEIQPAVPAEVPAATATETEPADVLADSGDIASLDFAPNATILSPDNTAKLKALAAKLNSDENISVRIMSYARDEEPGSGKARRQSLSRALAARSVLMDEGIRSTRIEVRALGNKVQQDKIYLEIIKRK